MYLWSPMSAPKVILVPTDFSEPANRALDYALELAQALGATVKVMHAYELRPIDVLDGAFVSDERAVDRLKTAAQAAMEDNLARHDKRGVAVGSLLAVGETRDAIHAAAQDVGANLISDRDPRTTGAVARAARKRGGVRRSHRGGARARGARAAEEEGRVGRCGSRSLRSTEGCARGPSRRCVFARDGLARWRRTSRFDPANDSPKREDEQRRNGLAHGGSRAFAATCHWAT